MNPEKPNVVLFLSDQHRWDCMEPYGNEDVRTPNLRELARKGVTFENCFTTFPVCTPARYSLLTGLYVHQHLGWTNHSTLPHGLATFPRLLREAGYDTACVGKMHFTPTYADMGFEKMVLAEQDGPGRYDDDYHRWLMGRGLVDRVDLRDQVGEFRARAPREYWDNFGAEPSNLADADYSTTWIGDRAVEEVSGWEGGGHLLVVGFIKPHHPFDAPPPWSGMYDPANLELLPGWLDDALDRDVGFQRGFFEHASLSEEALRRVLAQYYASISQLDHHVGRVVGVLEDLGLYDDSLVAYTSDHGDYMGFHHLLLKGNHMYDPVVRVPLVVKYPRGYDRPAGDRHAGLASLVDLTATILDATGAAIPQYLWNSLQPLDSDHHRDVVFAEADGGRYMVRTANRKLLLHGRDRELLFDLEEDPRELVDLSGDPDHSGDVESLEGALFNWLAFEARSPVHLDEDGPVVAGENVPARGDGHRERAVEYFRRKMRETL
ncbi:MAG: sulfatase-like hydrolase/transferase [Promethearchaeota archaeon]